MTITQQLFLVTLHHAMDDIPLKLFERLHQAESFAATVDSDCPEDLADILAVHCDMPSNVSITKFLDGVPSDKWIVKVF